MATKNNQRARAAETQDPSPLPWKDLPSGLQLILNADFLAKEYRRNARHQLVDHEVNDRRAAVIVYLSEVGPQTVNELARRLEQHKAAISALLIRMEGDGLVELVPNALDKRSKKAGLTPKGQQLAAPIEDVLSSVRRRALEGVSQADIELTNRVLQRVIANLAGDDGDDES